MLCLLYAILIGKQCWDSPSIERWDANNPKINKTLLTNDLNKIVNKELYRISINFWPPV